MRYICHLSPSATTCQLSATNAAPTEDGSLGFLAINIAHHHHCQLCQSKVKANHVGAARCVGNGLCKSCQVEWFDIDVNS